MEEAPNKQELLKELIGEFSSQINGDQLSDEALEDKTKLILDRIVGVVFPTKNFIIRAKEDSVEEK